MTVPPDPIAELKGWLAVNWDPDLTVREWWERLGNSGWAAPSLPVYGKGLSAAESVRVAETIAESGALPAPGGLGLMLAAPTIAVYGTPEQKERYIRRIVTGLDHWCQLFSEPGAGSDLTGLQTRAERDGDDWVITGQKVWTSGGKFADMGMLLARTDPDVPKHSGITYFAFDMKQPGVEVRPLREMTGRALFNEVFISEARVGDDAVIGGLNNGWAVANTTLGFERAGLGTGGSLGIATPGSIAGDLDRRAGDLTTRGAAVGPDIMSMGVLGALAKDLGKNADPLVRQDLARLYTLNRISRFLVMRQKALRASGGELPGNVGKLSMSSIVRQSRDLGLRLLGPRGTLHSYDNAAPLPGGKVAVAVTEMALFAQAPSIYGGSDEIQRNIVGERVLGLPKEPNSDKNIPFRDLPRN